MGIAGLLPHSSQSGTQRRDALLPEHGYAVTPSSVRTSSRYDAINEHWRGTSRVWIGVRLCMDKTLRRLQIQDADIVQ